MTIYSQFGVEQTAAMTHSQLGLLFESQLSGKPALNVLQVLCRFEGEEPDAPALAAAWQDLAARHDVLRLQLNPLDPEGPSQSLMSGVVVDFARQDWSDQEAEVQEAALDLWLEQDRRQGIRHDCAPSWRVRLIRLQPMRSVMVWTFHHALLDGGGYRLLLRDLFALYQRRRAGGVPAPDAPGRPGFVDHCRAVAALDHGPAQDFFRRHLSGVDAPNVLDPVFAPTAEDAAAADPQVRRCISDRLPEDLSEAIRDRARRAPATTANIVSAAWALVLARCSGRDEALFGLTRSGRHLLPGGAGIAGCQINTLPCRVRLAGQTLDGLLRQLRGFTLDTRAHEHVPISALAGICDIPGGVGLFDSIVMFDRGSLPRQMRALGPEWAHRHFEEYSQMATGLTLSAYDDPEMLLRLEYDPAKVSDRGAARLADYLRGALVAMAGAGDVPLSRIDMLPAAESRLLLSRGVPQLATVADPEGVPARFEAVVRRHPDRLAVVQIGAAGGLSFGALDARANHLAHQLHAQGVGPGNIVGLALPRGTDFVAAMLAVLKAQAAFLPLDPTYPLAVLQDMIGRSGAVALLSCADAAANLGPQAIPVLLLDDPALGGESASPPPRGPHDPERRAYVIFTSGSTGRPKGVEVPHRALSQHAQAITRIFGLTGDDRVLQFASLNFDVSIEEILPTLLAGARLVLRNDQVAQSMPLLLAALEEQGITVSNLPTAFWHVLVAHLEDSRGTARLPASLRLVIVGGERISGDLLLRWRRLCPQVRWLNCYGPTEATITSTWYDAADPPFEGGEVPIGRPTDHARAHVMAADGSLAPDGVGGELWLGGPAVALGYLGRPDLTEAGFPPDPFFAPARLYRSGDKASWRADGLLACHGRIDRQIKLRGYRIELSAIEAEMEADPAVAAAVAGLDRPGSDQARILAWVRLHEGAGPVDEAALAEALRRHLPAHMLPQIVTVEEFPQTPGGKVDMARLPRPAATQEGGGDADQPVDPATAQVQQIFCTLLGRDRVGPDQSFFDLGGHSLLSVRLMSLLERHFGQRLTLATLYLAPTPRLIAAELARGQADELPNCLVPIQPLGHMPPLFAVHILGAGGAFFRPLAAHLGDGQPLVGLTLDLLDPAAPTTLPEIAAIYRANIDRHAPDRPVQLIAVSQGSYLAFELAQQLLAAGRDVAALYLLDAEGPGGRPRRAPPGGITHYLSRLRRNFRGVVTGRWQTVRGELLFRLERLRLGLRRRGRVFGLLGHRGNVAAHQAAIDLAIAAYHPSPYPREITLFRAGDDHGDTPEGIASGLGWNLVAPAGLRMIQTGGAHLTMLQEPHVRELAGHMRPLLGRAAAPDRSPVAAPVRGFPPACENDAE